MVTLKKAIPGHDFIDFKNNDALSNWLESRKMNQHLVYQNTDYDNITEVSSTCLKCGVKLPRTKNQDKSSKKRPN